MIFLCLDIAMMNRSRRIAALPLTTRIIALISLVFGMALPATAQTSGQITTPVEASTSHSTASTILVFGDSLAAEYGLRRGSGWVKLLEDRLKQEGFPHRVINNSISGETTAGGLTRFPASIRKHKPSVVILELGANDGLRGLAPQQTYQNLLSMIKQAQAIQAKVLIIGIKVPPNYGADYSRRFDQVFADLARNTQSPRVTFMLEGIADDPKMFQADTIHPNEKAQPVILNNIWPVLKESGLLGKPTP
jgi:acyl-CoA thioesterase-1